MQTSDEAIYAVGDATALPYNSAKSPVNMMSYYAANKMEGLVEIIGGGIRTYFLVKNTENRRKILKKLEKTSSKA